MCVVHCVNSDVCSAFTRVCVCVWWWVCACGGGCVVGGCGCACGCVWWVCMVGVHVCVYGGCVCVCHLDLDTINTLLLYLMLYT